MRFTCDHGRAPFMGLALFAGPHRCTRIATFEQVPAL
jgi:hypothetical protein